VRKERKPDPSGPAEACPRAVACHVGAAAKKAEAMAGSKASNSAGGPFQVSLGVWPFFATADDPGPVLCDDFRWGQSVYHCHETGEDVGLGLPYHLEQARVLEESVKRRSQGNRRWPPSRSGARESAPGPKRFKCDPVTFPECSRSKWLLLAGGRLHARPNKSIRP